MTRSADTVISEQTAAAPTSPPHKRACSLLTMVQDLLFKVSLSTSVLLSCQSTFWHTSCLIAFILILFLFYYVQTDINMMR